MQSARCSLPMMSQPEPVASRRSASGSRRRPLEAARFPVASALTPHLTAVHMTWGAVNEWTRRRPTPVWPSSPITRRSPHCSSDHEAGGRHIDFYATQAAERLESSKRAQRITRWALRRFWAPVGSGVVPDTEVDFLGTYLFGDPRGTPWPNGSTGGSTACPDSGA